MFKDVGILGIGLWDGPVVTNEMIGRPPPRSRQLEPFYENNSGGPLFMSGLSISPERHPRTIAAVQRAYADPYRGIRCRRVLPKGADVADAEAEAAQKALIDAGLKSDDIDVVLVHSILPTHLQPKNAALIAHKMGIHRGAAWDVDAMCTSPLAHMGIGAALIASGQARHVLCVQSTDCSKVMDPNSSASLIMGDMATAFVLGPIRGAELAQRWCLNGKFYPMVQLRRPSMPYWAASEELVDIRFIDDLVGPYLQSAVENMKLCPEALREIGLRMDEVDLVITHQTAHWFPAFIEDSLGLKEGVMFHTFAEYGNVNACCVPVSLYEARRAGRWQRGSNILLFVPAAGQVCAAIAMRS